MTQQTEALAERIRESCQNGASTSDIMEMLEALSSQPPAPTWQPIETAPKDGSYFLAANQLGVWVCHYQPKAASGYVFDNPWRSVMLNHWHIADKAVQYHVATQWMPLPAAPAYLTATAGSTP